MMFGRASGGGVLRGEDLLQEEIVKFPEIMRVRKKVCKKCNYFVSLCSNGSQMSGKSAFDLRSGGSCLSDSGYKDAARSFEKKKKNRLPNRI